MVSSVAACHCVGEDDPSGASALAWCWGSSPHIHPSENSGLSVQIFGAATH